MMRQDESQGRYEMGRNTKKHLALSQRLAD
jgi:hypothetical protein